MRTTVSTRGQTVIPRAIRDKLGIESGTKLHWEVRGGTLIAVPLPDDPIKASIGILKGRGPTVADLLADRQQERRREREQEEREERLRRPRTS
jgi:AbrB family looped-hinge helix DNA binding protein